MYHDVWTTRSQHGRELFDAPVPSMPCECGVFGLASRLPRGRMHFMSAITEMATQMPANKPRPACHQNALHFRSPTALTDPLCEESSGGEEIIVSTMLLGRRLTSMKIRPM